MGDRLQAGKPSRYVASHPGQLSLAIPPWLGTMSTSENWDINRHTARCTSPVSVVWQCELVSGWGLMKQRSAPLYGPYGWGRTLWLTTIDWVSESGVGEVEWFQWSQRWICSGSVHGFNASTCRWYPAASSGRHQHWTYSVDVTGSCRDR